MRFFWQFHAYYCSCVNSYSQAKLRRYENLPSSEHQEKIILGQVFQVTQNLSDTQKNFKYFF